MPWHGRTFPRSTEDANTPEALPATQGVLPHLHSDWRDRFPIAVACAELEDEDPEDDTELEARGIAIGSGLGTTAGARRKEEEKNGKNQKTAWMLKTTDLECMNFEFGSPDYEGSTGNRCDRIMRGKTEFVLPQNQSIFL
jgi:hypothetical protein